MKYTLQQASTATGKAKSTLQRAIKSGKLSATRNEDGSYTIDAAELNRCYQLRDTGSAPVAIKQYATSHETDALQVKIELLERQLLREQAIVSDLQRRLDRSEDERRETQAKLTALLTHQPIVDSTPEPTPEPTQAPPPAMDQEQSTGILRSWVKKIW